MRLRPLHVSPSTLQEFEQGISNPHEDVRRLGKIKLGITRFSFSVPFYTKSSSRPNNNAVKNRTIDQHIQTIKPHNGPVKTTALGQTEQHKSVEPEALTQYAAQGLLINGQFISDAQSVENALNQFDPIEYMQVAKEQAAQGFNVPPSLDTQQRDALWALYFNLARTPLAADLPFLQQKIQEQHQETLTLLSQLHHHFQTQSGHSRTLADLLREAQQAPNKTSIAHQALTQAVNLLTKEPTPIWALNAFKNGLMSTDANSDFMKIDARLRKMGVWIKRAETPRWRWVKLLPTIKKTPFKAVKFGTLGADRGDIGNHRKAYLDALSNLNSALNEESNPLVNLTLNSNLTGIQRILHKRRFSAAEQALAQLKSTTENTVDSSPYNNAEAIIKQLKTIRKFTKNAINIPSATAPSTPNTEPQVDRLKQHIQTIKDIIGKNKHSNLDNESAPSSILAHLQHVTDHIQGASRWKMFSGGVWGVGTKGITATLTSLAFGLLARIKIDLRWLRTRLAGIELAMPAYNMELMLYSSKQTGQQTGIGGTVGPSIGIAEITGGGNIKAWSADLKENDGIVLRMHRERGKEPKARFKAMLNVLFELSKQPQAPGETLKHLLEEFPELSTNLIEHSKEYKQTHAASLEANAGIVAGPVKLGPTIETGVEYQSHIQKDHLDKTGFLKVERHVHGRGLKASAEARFDLRFNAIREPFRLTPLTLDNLCISTDFLLAGRQLRQDIAYHQGRILPVSFYEIEYQSFDDFQNAVLSNKSAWDQAHQHKASTGNLDPVDQFLFNARENINTVQTFAARWELKQEAVKLINQYNTAIMLKEHSTDQGELKQVQTHREWVHLLLNDPSSYEPRSFRVYERQDRNEGIGLNAAARLEAINQAEGVYTHSRLM